MPTPGDFALGRYLGIYWVAGHPIDVYDNRHLFPEGVYGMYDPARNAIAVDFSLHPSRARRAFVHEVIHAMEDIGQLHLDHDTVRRLAAMLQQTVIDPRNDPFRQFFF